MLTIALVVALAAAPNEVSVTSDGDDCETVPLFAAVVLPGAHFGSSVAAAGSGAIELRPFTWAALRTGFEGSKLGYTVDFLGVKLSPLATARFRPYLTGAVSGDFPSDRGGQSYLGFLGAIGVDVALGSGFFLQAEGRMRVFKPGLQGGAFIGVGFEFL